MAEYIDREATCEDCVHYDICIFHLKGNENKDCVHFKNKADVVEVRHGDWLPIVIQEGYFDPPYCDTCKCSMCGYGIDVSETVYNYCPNCGAKMDGKEQDDEQI